MKYLPTTIVLFFPTQKVTVHLSYEHLNFNEAVDCELH